LAPCGRVRLEFDLPGVNAQDVDLDVERNVLTVKAERPTCEGRDTEMIAAGRPRGVFSRQLFLGDNLDMDRVRAEYDAGVLRLTIAVSEQAKPPKIDIAGNGQRHAITS
jgi:HSP20 family protein